MCPSWSDSDYVAFKVKCSRFRRSCSPKVCKQNPQRVATVSECFDLAEIRAG